MLASLAESPDTKGGHDVTPGSPTATHANLGSKRVVDALRPRAVAYRVWDPQLLGFGLLVSPSGKKSFLIQYRSKGIKRRMHLGDSRKLPAAAARNLARELFGSIATGRDPLQERRASRVTAVVQHRARRAAATLEDVAENYLETLLLTKSRTWAREARRLWKAHILPALGARKAVDIVTADVRAIHESLHEMPVTANRVRSVLHAILTRAIGDGARPPGSNPCIGIEPYAETPRDRYLDADEWRRFAAAIVAERKALADVETWDTRPRQLDAVLLLALTGARKGALTPRRWRDVDYEAHVLKVEPAHKGTSRVHLGTSALEILRTWHAERGTVDGFIFPGQRRHDGPRPTNRKHDARPVLPPTYISTTAPVWYSLMARAELEDFTIHDLRRSFATAAGDVGISAHLIGGLLGHAVPGVTAVYARRSDPALSDAANRTSAEVARRLNLSGLADPQILPMAGRGR